MSTYSQTFFQFHLEERWGMDVQTRRSIKRYHLFINSLLVFTSIGLGGTEKDGYE